MTVLSPLGRLDLQQNTFKEKTSGQLRLNHERSEGLLILMRK